MQSEKKTVSPIEKIIEPVSRFIHLEYTAGIVLLFFVVVAIVWANSGWGEGYHELWEQHVVVKFGEYGLDKPLHVWINDGLMAIFFFLIGLELKREFMAGELSTVKKAVLPLGAALGGMIVPALIFFCINKGTAASGGWGIPMATDIAFAIGVLSIIGKRVPGPLKVYLSALAVADDLGAILVIALFYSSGVNMVALVWALFFGIVACCGNLLGIRHVLFYLFVGVIIWIFFLFSGIHATIAGVLAAFAIPARSKIDENQYLQKLNTLSEKFKKEIPSNNSLTTPEQHRIIEEIKKHSQEAETPLQKIETSLHPVVAFVIMPLFALSNAGIAIRTDFFSTMTHGLSLGIIVGLIVGKFSGIFSFTYLMVKLKVSALPDNTSWKMIAGVALIAGIGFTMSIFITGLAFKDPLLVGEAKGAILVGSAIAAILGTFVLRSARSA